MDWMESGGYIVYMTDTLYSGDFPDGYPRLEVEDTHGSMSAVGVNDFDGSGCRSTNGLNSRVLAM